MSDPVHGRNQLVAALAAPVLIGVGFALFAARQTWLEQFGRPLLLVLTSVLIWHGRLWARWLLVLVGLGFLLAGPLAAASGVPFFFAGLLFWMVSAAYGAAIGVLFASPDVRRYLASRTAAKAGA